MGIITNNIIAANDNFSKKLIFREDILRAVEELKTAKPDNVHTKRARINDMLSAYDIECGRNTTAKQYIDILKKSDIPSVKDLPALCLEEMTELYKNYKHPQDFMERTVNHLVAPEYDIPGTSVRLKILKQFLGKLNYMEGTGYYDEKLKKIVLEEYDGVIADIGEEIFDKYLVSNHFYETHKLLEAIIEVYADFLYKKDEVDDKLNSMISEVYKSFNKIKAADALSFIYERNHRSQGKAEANYTMNNEHPELISHLYEYLNAKFKEKQQSINLLLDDSNKKDRKKQFYMLRQAITEGAYDSRFINDSATFALINKVSSIEIDERKTDIEVLDYLSVIIEKSTKSFPKINDSIIKSFKKYISAKGKAYDKAVDRARRPEKKSGKTELLHISTELAEGRFKKTYAEMKEILYYMAFAFDMTVFYGQTDKEYDFDRDINKLLFEDYYCDNVIRYLKNYQSNGVYYEIPGIAIRHNNFVEIVYLYWLNKSGDEYSQYRKLIKAVGMIDDIVKKKDTASKKVLTLKQTGKKYKEAVAIAKHKDISSHNFRHLFYGENNLIKNGSLPDERLFSLTEEQFEDVILHTYNLLEEKCTYSGSKSYEGFYNQSDMKTAKKYYSEYLNELKEYIVVGEETEDTIPKVIFFDDDFLEGIAVDGKDGAELKKITEKINERLVKFCNVDIRKKTVSRTNMLFAYYLLFISKKMKELDGEALTDCYADFYSSYTDSLNAVLWESSFQLISQKNLLDMILIYSAFVRLKLYSEA